MTAEQRARVLRIHLDESDRWQGRPLHEAIVEKCLAMGIAGATVLRGVEGYGETAEIHRRRLFGKDRPIVIHIVDTAANLERLAPEVEAMMARGLMATSDVVMLRVRKSA